MNIKKIRNFLRSFLYLSPKTKLKVIWGGGGMGWWGVGEWHKGSSICDTPAKELEDLRPVVSKNTILLLRQRQDSQIAIYIDPKQH